MSDFRTGKIASPFAKKEQSGVSFENPRYENNAVDMQATGMYRL